MRFFDSDDFDDFDDDDADRNDWQEDLLGAVESLDLDGDRDSLDDDYDDDEDVAPATVRRGLGGDDGDPNDEWLDLDDPSEWARDADPTDSEGDFAASELGDDPDELAAEQEDRHDDGESDSDTLHGLL